MSGSGRTVIDAHHHLWQLARFPYRWLRPDAPPRPFGDHAPIKRDFLVADYRRAMAGIRLAASVHVEANAEAPDPLDECRWLATLAERDGWPTVAVAHADLTRPDIDAALAGLAALPLVRGVRMPLAWSEAPRWRFAARPGIAREDGFARGAACLARHGLVLDVIILPGQLEEIAACAAARPDLVIVIDHLAMPHLPDAVARETWRDGLRRAAAQPNLHIKLSGLWPLDRGWRIEALREPLREAVGRFGPERCMWGSNLPIESLMCPAQQQIAILESILDDASETERDAVFRAAAARVYRIPVSGTTGGRA